MQILGSNRINNRNRLSYVLNQVNRGPWFAIAIHPKGMIVDPSSGRREKVVVLGGKNLSEYRTSITFAPIADSLVSFADGFFVKVWFDGLFLVAKVLKGGASAFAKIYLENGVENSKVLELVAAAIKKAKENYWRMLSDSSMAMIWTKQGNIFRLRLPLPASAVFLSALTGCRLFCYM